MPATPLKARELAGDATSHLSASYLVIRGAETTSSKPVLWSNAHNAGLDHRLPDPAPLGGAGARNPQQPGRWRPAPRRRIAPAVSTWGLASGADVQVEQPTASIATIMMVIAASATAQTAKQSSAMAANIESGDDRCAGLHYAVWSPNSLDSCGCQWSTGGIGRAPPVIERARPIKDAHRRANQLERACALQSPFGLPAWNHGRRGE
jgi:hypothetical protein